MKWAAVVLVLLLPSTGAVAHPGKVTCSIQKFERPQLTLECPPQKFYAPLRVGLEFTVEEDLPTPWMGSICKFEVLTVVEVRDGKETRRKEMWIEYKDTAGQVRRSELKKFERLVLDEERSK